MQSRRPILAVDFDGTLTEDHCFPQLGTPKKKIIELVKKYQAAGWIIILWTCRTGFLLDEAVEFCKEQGIYPDYINENAPYVVPNFRKIFADIYLDDKGFNANMDIELLEAMITDIKTYPWISMDDIKNEREKANGSTGN